MSLWLCTFKVSKAEPIGTATELNTQKNLNKIKLVLDKLDKKILSINKIKKINWKDDGNVRGWEPANISEMLLLCWPLF